MRSKFWKSTSGVSRSRHHSAGLVVVILAMGLLAWIIPSAALTSEDPPAVATPGSDETGPIVQAEQSLEAGGGPARGESLRCSSTGSNGSAGCTGVSATNLADSAQASDPTASGLPLRRWGASLAYDAKDGYVLLFGGSGQELLGDTWKFVHGTWTQLEPKTHPSAREDASMTYDAKDGYVLLFGGCNPAYDGCVNQGYLNDSWKFASGVWAQVRTNFILGTYAAGLVYDVKDGYVVLFGGMISQQFCGEQPCYSDATYTYAGGTWTELSPHLSPGSLAEASMTYDSKDGYLLLFGGYNNTASPVNTWKFVGGAWSQLSPKNHPPNTGFAATMAYDSKNAYAVYFSAGYQTTSYTWQFSGGEWTNLSSKTGPPSRYLAQSVYDAKDGYVVLFGGVSADGCIFLADTWGFSGGSWTLIVAPPLAPPPLTSAAMTYDARDGYLVLFGGYLTCLGTFSGETWKLAGGVWSELSPRPSPPPRAYASMVYDAKDGYVLLFGGYGSSGYLRDTWTFRGGVWTKLTSPVAPSARQDVSMTYDPEAGYVVLFGGEGSSGSNLEDTWTFAAGAWTKLTPKTSPPARSEATMAFDAKDGYAVLFGGWGNSGYLADTWKFAAGAWTKLTPKTSPPGRIRASMTFDAKDGYVLLFGGEGNGIPSLGDTWKFAGAGWTNITPKVSPAARSEASMTYDAKDGYVVLFGGDDFTDTWKFVADLWTVITD